MNVSLKGKAKPLFVDPKSKLIQTLENAYRSLSHDYESPIVTMGGGTYAKKMPNCVAFGSEFPHLKKRGGDAHQKDEAIELDQLVLACAIYCKAIYDLTR